MYPVIIVWNNSDYGHNFKNYYGIVNEPLEIFDVILCQIKEILINSVIPFEDYSWSEFCRYMQGDYYELKWEIKYFDNEWKDYQIDWGKLKIEFKKLVREIC